MPVVVTVTAVPVIAVMAVPMVTPMGVFLVTPARIMPILVITPVTAVLAKDSPGY